MISREEAVRGSINACCSGSPLPALRTEEIAASARLLSALADPTRLGIVSMLAHADEPVCVCEITPAFNVGQPTISHHLRVLREAGLVGCEKRGLWVYYWLEREVFGRVTLYLTHLQRAASGSIAL